MESQNQWNRPPAKAEKKTKKGVKNGPFGGGLKRAPINLKFSPESASKVIKINQNCMFSMDWRF